MIDDKRPPADLCPTHARIWRKYADLTYCARHPHEWPGLSAIMDNRTTHAQRAADWDRKTRDQLDQIERFCRSGSSPQCDRKPPS